MVIGELTVSLQVAMARIEELEKQLAAMNGNAAANQFNNDKPD